jgi:hypothetical protein
MQHGSTAGRDVEQHQHRGCHPPGQDFVPAVMATRMCARIDDDQQAAAMQRYG